MNIMGWISQDVGGKKIVEQNEHDEFEFLKL
jgi:hypothetical protein